MWSAAANAELLPVTSVLLLFGTVDGAATVACAVVIGVATSWLNVPSFIACAISVRRSRQLSTAGPWAGTLRKLQVCVFGVLRLIFRIQLFGIAAVRVTVPPAVRFAPVTV